ncbi:hypothetical protein IEQ34_014596 [Dendrobium chrysotoxum]|uniref:Uncharacterized protein n=1 Tax=Dendrobium chrysotoxum TaxID=161865 RepID=A0AAV7G4A8_DENCH|nr:hypothetical protein IEQ34_014596 [Dendrobium chrysotoxum]
MYANAADEIMQVEEETGIKLNVQDMVNLTAFLDPTTSCKVFPSPSKVQTIKVSFKFVQNFD